MAHITLISTEERSTSSSSPPCGALYYLSEPPRGLYGARHIPFISSTVPSPVHNMGTPLFHLNSSSRIDSMPVLPYRSFVPFHKEGYDGRWEGGLFHVHLFNVTSSEIQITAITSEHYNRADGYYRARLLTLGWHWENFPLDNATFLFGSFSHLVRWMTEQSWMYALGLDVKALKEEYHVSLCFW